MNITIVGTGYAGLSLAVLLSQQHKATAVDIISEKVEMINHRISMIRDDEIEKYLAEKELNLIATLDGASAYQDAESMVANRYDSVLNNVKDKVYTRDLLRRD